MFVLALCKCVAECLCVCAQCLSSVRLFAVPWAVARQALLSLGFPRQKCWSGLPHPTPGDLSDPGSELLSLLHRQAGSLLLAPPGCGGSVVQWQAIQFSGICNLTVSAG